MKNSELENLGSLIKVLIVSSKCFREKSEGFISEFSVLGTVQNGKLGVEKPRKDILRGFRVFDLTSESMLNAKKKMKIEQL